MNSRILFLPQTASPACEEMARDLAILKEIGPEEVAFRHYKIDGQAATFGYFESWETVRSQLGPGWDLQRRPSAGGIVQHPGGFTYTLVFGRDHPLVQISPVELYQWVHSRWQEALQELGIPCHIVIDRNLSASQLAGCATQAEPGDLISTRGQKLAGAAMKRTPNGILIQGHLWPPCDSSESSWPSPSILRAQFQHFLTHHLGISPKFLSALPHNLSPRSLNSESAKIGAPSWNQKR